VRIRQALAHRRKNQPVVPPETLSAAHRLQKQKRQKVTFGERSPAGAEAYFAAAVPATVLRKYGLAGGVAHHSPQIDGTDRVQHRAETTEMTTYRHCTPEVTGLAAEGRVRRAWRRTLAFGFSNDALIAFPLQIACFLLLTTQHRRFNQGFSIPATILQPFFRSIRHGDVNEA
jgi:hypothetical protein